MHYATSLGTNSALDFIGERCCLGLSGLDARRPGPCQDKPVILCNVTRTQRGVTISASFRTGCPPDVNWSLSKTRGIRHNPRKPRDKT